MKKYFKIIHRWLGLTSGLFVFIIAITGCLYAFQEEIQNTTQPYRFIEKENNPFLLPSQLKEIAIKHLPNKELHSIKYHTESKSAEAIFYQFEPTYYYIVYLNPYNGKILHTQNMEEGFFPFILKGHFYMWLPPHIGQPFVAIVTILFFLILLTGIVLWYPKNKNALKNKIWFNWKNTTRWKRKNFDIHSIVGFYSFFIALIFVITGLVWGLQWFASGYYKTFGGQKGLTYQEPNSKIGNNKPTNATDILYNNIIANKVNFKSVEVHPPINDTASIAININTEIGTFWKIDYRYYDQYTLQEITSKNIYSRYDNTTFADKLMRMNYDIHTGAIFGIWGKIFMFLMSLLIASLPLTGFLFWYGRQKKK